MCHLPIIKPGSGTPRHKLEPACEASAHGRPPSIALWRSFIGPLRLSSFKSMEEELSPALPQH